jgi:hypothetical protein
MPKAGGSSDTSFLSDFGVPGMGTMPRKKTKKKEKITEKS